MQFWLLFTLVLLWNHQAWSEFSFGCSSWLPTSILSKGLCLSYMHGWRSKGFTSPDARAALNDAEFMQPAHVSKGSSAEEAKHSAQPSSGGCQDKEKKADSAHLASPPLFSKPSVQDVIQPASDPLFSRSSKLSPQKVEKEEEAAALAWAW
ncbi:hypothetical protein M758_UG040800 [Ceratodon purpureus]|nr:hypothetical protein M758_UG040800 [Ceratodon purpureus]